VGAGAAQVDPKEMETYIYRYGSELANTDPDDEIAASLTEVHDTPLRWCSLFFFGRTAP
jgi:hypothetical protein